MYDFKFADIGEGIHEGQILKWEFKIGDIINEGETLVIIETDKVNAEIPSPVTGTITKLGPNEGETVNVGDTLALINDGTGNENETKIEETVEPITEGEEKNAAGVVGTIEVSSEVIASSVESTTIKPTNEKRILATPVARKLAKDLKIDINTVIGTGENNRVLKEDIYKINESTNLNEKVINTKNTIPNMSFNNERTRREKVSKLRKTIAENMSLSKSMIPHTTIMDEIIVSDLVEFRTTQKELANVKEIKLTYMPFIIKALTKTLKEFPIFNSSYDQNNLEIVYKNYMNIGIAVDTPDGLIVPNIKDADRMSIFEIAKDIMIIKEKASSKKLTLNDLNDGTISITNYGIYDATFGAPVIKYPEVAIIGIGRIMKKPVVINDEIVIKDILPLSMSIDHRVIDGGDAGRFLKLFKSYLTNPMLLLLS
ncbi:dihydrolipoamide acyltransferase [Candidatus Izimaplasma bacterium ZiA1]|uniref:dihydrolipoamide acetyltransferase family protein n=1 Tax=Candidatus Izimoplasma sp. ZiA1 TaxID=2024899 RepID=UPI000BAA6328|nr:dihydrolipoamide acyltransferase [Candidatus Izimaplasma bacterium ZiA1]